MCAVLLLCGPEALSRMDVSLRRLEHRGPDEATIWSEGPVAIGFNRLAINDKGPTGQQPYTHGDLVGAFNGEIYNYEELVQRYGLAIDGSCDTHVLLPLIELLGARVIDVIDGFYAGVVFNRRTGRLYTLRDHIGKKPLLICKSRTELFITSELKAVLDLDWFDTLPKGFASVDTESGSVDTLRPHGRTSRSMGLRQLLDAAVTRRLPREDDPVGVFLSGGLDSSIIAALVAAKRPDAVYYSLASEGSPDFCYSNVMVEFLGLKNVRTLALPSAEALPDLIEKVVHATESFNPSIVSNGLCTFLLAEAAHTDGLKVVLTGEGADELFGGYHYFSADEPWRDTRDRLIDDMHVTELRRLDSCTMAHAVEARCPFLDRAVRSHSDGLDHRDLYEFRDGHRQNKVALRRACQDLLPPTVLNRKKTSFDVGSGVRDMVVSHLHGQGRSEQRELEAVWRRAFGYDSRHPYFHSYPVFDKVIATRGATHR